MSFWLCTLVEQPDPAAFAPKDGERALGLIRPQVCPIKDSNIALLGSKVGWDG